MGNVRRSLTADVFLCRYIILYRHVVVNCLDIYLRIFVFSAVRRIFFPKLQTIARKKYSGKGEINI